MLRALILVLVAISVIQAYAAVIPNTIPVCQSLNERQLVDSSSMLEVRGLRDKLQKFRTKFRTKMNPTSKSKDSDSIRPADTPHMSQASLKEEALLPSGASNSTTPGKHRGGQRKMGPQPKEDESKGKEPALANSSPFNDTSQITEGSDTTSHTSSSTKHHHHHHHRTSAATANIHKDDDDDTSTLKPPRRHRGSTVTGTTNVPPKPDLKRVSSSMSSGSEYAVTISSEDGNQSIKDPRPERLWVPGHHRTSSAASKHNSLDAGVMRTGSSASRGPGGPNRGRPRTGSMNNSMDRSSTREREKEREKEREREKAENRASALYAATQNTQNMQTTQSAAFNANTFATNFGNAAAPVPGMTKPPGTR
ncbi:uncharacterized protein C8R40DRAFT_1173904 [Lentinula edodes]|uniref:uncharacterized protein n=1 Tax=Lentinula edodes TaxID=5353 RepID=UPI001E8D0F42|nr:uncharacterized protein C8R40DRAFT_1173904 [Lentinula edodes]KAH7872172.1 hypothetical protein C8R40DRAFT_1173904 [Lentinula edodes]